jgi:hypothetical protein
MDPNQEFCRREDRSFPSTEFYDDPNWGRVHDRKPLHTVGGTLINKKHKVVSPPAAPLPPST